RGLPRARSAAPERTPDRPRRRREEGVEAWPNLSPWAAALPCGRDHIRRAGTSPGRRGRCILSSRATARDLRASAYQTMTTMTEVFRRLHESGCFVIPNPWDIGSARLLVQLGFKALATTSSGFAWSSGHVDGAVPL